MEEGRQEGGRNEHLPSTLGGARPLPLLSALAMDDESLTGGEG